MFNEYILPLLQAIPWAMVMISLVIILLTIYSYIHKSLSSKTNDTGDLNRKTPHRIAFLIASKDGEKTINEVIKAAKANGRSVFVVSDGSKDKTVKIARQSGANVLALKINIGKPSALFRAYKHFNLSKRFDAIAILDDDVIVDKHFIKHTKNIMNGDNVITVGRNISRWPDSEKWNIWIATRAYSYWSYQLTLRQIQSTFNTMNCISGSNSLYRTEVLDKVLHANTPYIVDDTYWTLETHRLNLGKIVYASNAKAYIQDPTSFKDWYKQNLRWMWGTFQGIIGHNIGTKADMFHMSYVALMTQWVFYIISAPLLIYLLFAGGIKLLPLQLLVLTLGYGIWVSMAAFSLGKKRLILFTPAVIIADFIFRAIMIHALFKALNQRTVESCVWKSPERFENA